MNVRGLTFGFFLAALAQFLALGLAGAGHGWVTAFFASFALWVLLPLTFSTVGWARSRGGVKSYLLSLLAIGLAADTALIIATMREGAEYFWTMFDQAVVLLMPWLLIWVSWQLVAASALVRGHESTER